MPRCCFFLFFSSILYLFYFFWSFYSFGFSSNLFIFFRKKSIFYYVGNLFTRSNFFSYSLHTAYVFIFYCILHGDEISKCTRRRLVDLKRSDLKLLKMTLCCDVCDTREIVLHTERVEAADGGGSSPLCPALYRKEEGKKEREENKNNNRKKKGLEEGNGIEPPTW